MTDTASAVSSRSFWVSDFMLMAYVAGLSLVLHLIAIANFGFFRDEFYYIACSEHLDFGYVDQPPLSILILKGIRLLLGDSVTAIRILPILTGAALVFMAGILAKELGGRKFAVLLASLAAFASIGNFFLFHIYSMNYLDILLWQVIIWTVIRIIKTQNSKLWLLFGLLAGLGLQNKISVLFLGFGILVGAILTQERKHLTSRHLWLGGGLALLLFSPYVIWNWIHSWPHLEFIRNARAFKMAEVSPLDFFFGQVLYHNPATLLLWMAGLWYFFFHKQGKQFRLFGWMFITIYVLFTIQQAKDYYLAGGYPILLAGGAVLVGNAVQKQGWRWAQPVLVVFILIPTLVFCPMTLPILSVEKTITHMQNLGIAPSTGERHELSALPQHFADMFGWDKMVATVAEAFQKLTPEEKEVCYIYVRNYGEAGAIDLLGRTYGLPNASCTHNNYWLWGPQAESNEVGIIFGFSQDIQASYDDLSQYFEKVELAGIFTCTYCMPYENNRPIFICRNMKGSLQDIWQQQKNYN